MRQRLQSTDLKPVSYGPPRSCKLDLQTPVFSLGNNKGQLTDSDSVDWFLGEFRCTTSLFDLFAASKHF